VKTRFAPSPTGRLHLGNARTALFNALYARAHGGRFLLRIEDTDPERSREAFVAALVEDLRWLGLAWEEGEEVGGAAGPYRQSARGELYARFYRELEAAGRAYPCFCTPEQLRLSRKAQRAAGRPPRYAGTCARLEPAAAAARLAAGEPATLRFRVPAEAEVLFDDLVRGPQRFAAGDIGDFIIRRADGTPAFFLCNAVDDALMGVTHVLRGEDHLTNTPRQLLLLEALGLAAPRYGHIALVVGADGAPLSKRAGDISLADLRGRGYLPLALVNYLARLGHHYADEAFMDLEALGAGFAAEHLGTSPARFDLAQLDHWQREAVSHADDEALWRWMAAAVGERVPAAARGAFVAAVRDNVLFPIDAAQWAERLYRDPPDYAPEAREAIAGAGSGFFRAALNAPLDGTFKALADEVKGATGARGRGLFQPLRAALTGVTHGPEMGRVYPLLGAARVRARLAAAREAAG
jgi:glutamyl-tRNA synthetase